MPPGTESAASAPNTITLTISTPPGHPPCVLQDVRPLTIVKGPGNSTKVQVVASATNTQDITLMFNPDETEAVFDPQPPGTVQLAPGHKLVLTIRADVGVQHRKVHFHDLDPNFARVISFKTTPGRCGSGDIADVVVET